MDIGRLYQQATAPTLKQEGSNPVVDNKKALEEQTLKLSAEESLAQDLWARNTSTIKFVREQESRKREILTNALNLVRSYSQHNNHHQIINLLTQVNTIEETLVYARPSNHPTKISSS